MTDSAAQAREAACLCRAVALVCAVHGVLLEDLYSRRMSAVVARHRLYWLLHRAGLTYTAIGYLLGRDRSGVAAGVRRHEARRAACPSLPAFDERTLAAVVEGLP